MLYYVRVFPEGICLTFTLCLAISSFTGCVTLLFDDAWMYLELLSSCWVLLSFAAAFVFLFELDGMIDFFLLPPLTTAGEKSLS